MPYDRNADLPESVRDNLPEHAQTIYREAFNSAFEEYKSAKDRRVARGDLARGGMERRQAEIREARRPVAPKN